MYNKQKIIFLMGPTTSNKTKFAIKLTQIFPIDIISVDSGSIYKELNIGTAKPTLKELCLAPHSLINIKNITEYYSAQSFRQDALYEINKSLSNNRIPVLVGGTMFYYHALINGLSPLPERNLHIRKKILKKNNFYFKGNLHKELLFIDPISAKRIHPNDLQRIIRALEVYFISGKKISDLIKDHKYKFPYHVLQFICFPQDKYILHRKIEYRLRKMLSSGFQEEVENLLKNNNFNINNPGMKCLGYREMCDYILNKISYQKMFNKILLSTKKLAKNQITWLKKDKNSFWLNSEKKNSINFIIKNIDIFLNKK
ncbi:tRNA (adenosine(37)-N6)-dimethylallyltransferase MiaA [Buchnera aphidicola]|uniref:tRNA (adenosine(37)-N6)-dimethylallyltransferase MiaA n=1 Tax=Buchnera aphidicola TaxID=9 RepID=UPI00223801BE|nr:tRNA (adenosine(37)-N6)-dimethylallyltransferase MiaA [Buchnera aphidicola]MCW5197446.1 tRNA (adenosine(37)-N6)-dimethylallyltransferase MiaA [Buchnera aphidicola (Chaitophorus viminalis)]